MTTARKGTIVKKKGERPSTSLLMPIPIPRLEDAANNGTRSSATRARRSVSIETARRQNSAGFSANSTMESTSLLRD
jgi:hypothetical protein